MRDTLTRENAPDFARRYIGTYGYLVQGDKKTLVYMQKADHMETTFTDVGGYSYTVYANSGVEFEFIPVDRGFYNTVSGTYFLHRIPARQWSRGISESNTAVYLLSAQGLSAISCNIANLFKVFQEGIDTQQAVNEWQNNKRASFALSKHFAVSNKYVSFYNAIIGDVTKNKVITVKESRVAQEFKDSIRRNGLNLDVVYE